MNRITQNNENENKNKSTKEYFPHDAEVILTDYGKVYIIKKK